MTGPTGPDPLTVRYRIASARQRGRRWDLGAASPDGGSGSTRTLRAAVAACRRDARRRGLSIVIIVVPTRADNART